jgi:hypothetical protein
MNSEDQFSLYYNNLNKNTQNLINNQTNPLNKSKYRVKRNYSTYSNNNSNQDPQISTLGSNRKFKYQSSALEDSNYTTNTYYNAHNSHPVLSMSNGGINYNNHTVNNSIANVTNDVNMININSNISVVPFNSTYNNNLGNNNSGNESKR